MVRCGSTLAGTIAFFILVVILAASTARAEGLSPEETLRVYLEALQAQKYETMYDLSSKGMRQGRSKEAFVAEQKYLTQLAEVKIFGFEIHKGRLEGDVAKVPNLLSSQDKFLNQLGVDEHEVYTLVREDEKWKIDQQEIVIGKKAIAEWFEQPVE